MNFSWFSELSQTEAALITVMSAGLISLVTSLVVAIIGLIRQRKNLFINTVTSNRIQWIETLKELTAEYIQLTGISSGTFEVYGAGDEEQRTQFFERLRIIRNRLCLLLNYKGILDGEIIVAVNHVYNAVESMYEIMEVSNCKEDKDKISYIGLKVELGDIRALKAFGLSETAKLNDFAKDELLVLFNDFIKKNSDKFLRAPSNIMKDIESKHNELIMLVHIYSKLEWSRVKKESKGNFRKVNVKKLNSIIRLMKDEYRFNLFNYKDVGMSDYLV